VPYKKYENRSKVNLRNNCKTIHFKKLLQDLICSSVTPQLREQYFKFLADFNITPDKISICTIDKFSKYLGIKITSPIKYQLLNSVINGRDKPSMEEVNEAIELFNVFVSFIHDISPQYTMKYDFYLNKIFMHLNIKYDYSKIAYKDNIKNNKDMIYWTKFVKYGISEYSIKEKLSTPYDEQTIQPREESDTEYIF